jgi:hypothetical protein
VDNGSLGLRVAECNRFIRAAKGQPLEVLAIPDVTKLPVRNELNTRNIGIIILGLIKNDSLCSGSNVIFEPKGMVVMVVRWLWHCNL